MPGLQLPRAAFEPISPDLDFTELIESTPNFMPVTRIPAHAIEEQGIEDFEKLVKLHVIQAGKPLVVEGYGSKLEKWIFSPRWLKDNHGSKVEFARDLTHKTNVPLTIQHYLSSMGGLTDQFDATNYKDPSRQRMYLKDIDCPPVWHEKLRSLLPPFLYYMNGSVGGKEGEVAAAGDLMSSLPEEMRAMNMMCYIGHEGTYTPAHREMCATLGHNIMVEASTGGLEDGKPTKPGSSIWFMTEKKDLKVVSEYWLSTLGHDIEIEDHFAQINAWKSAPFKTWVVEQKVGDFILIPPLAPHQVWNRGTRTMKVAWNRTTAETLDLALTEALPRARMVCRDEQYKNKAIIYFSLKKYSGLLERATSRDKLRYRNLQTDIKRLFALFTQILLSESFSTRIPEPKNVELIPFSSNITCSYCRCNIFNRFLTCPSCIGKFPDGEDDTYDICMDCFVMGRSCACISKLRWVEQFRWKDLTRDHERWRNQIAKLPIPKSRKRDTEVFEPLSVEQEKYEKKTLAEICQVELKRRPWTDIKKPVKDNVDDDDEDHRDSNRKRRKITKADKHKYSRCHICGPTLNWKLETCSQCNLHWCYGSLYRAFDIMPMTVLEVRSWKCPRCERICPCANCKRRDPTIEGYVPTETRIGHDTKKIADIRSVESLVDFSHSNLFWLKKSGEHPETSQDSRRMQLRIEEAEKAKLDEPVLDDHDSDDGEVRPEGDQNNDINLDESLIDPALMGIGRQTSFVVPQNAVFREDMADRYQPTEGITFEYPEPEQPAEQNKPQEFPVDPNLFQTNGQAPEAVNGGEMDEDEPEDLPVDPRLDDGAGSRRKRGIEIDDDFTLSRRSISRINVSGTRKVATRRSQPNPMRPDELEGSGSDQSEGEDMAEKQTSQAMLRPRSSRPAKKTVKKSVAAKTLKSKAAPPTKITGEVSQTEEMGESIPAAQPEPKSPLEPIPEMNGSAKQTTKTKTAKLQAMGWVEDDDNDGWA
ncbi:JmjC domain-containing protein [Nannizzia gypsea CBS 118893]|uniref:JmjC domain-containing protein n=1 Tax=Arthroderma gypseum (strain ATCC MYA-4604 / CBS 118893) TaxID=535722 RepID=E5QYM4_ARTGP|nr:JmjC domain-containing protein [Nannizzia gypsea CBS 118893]EFQ98887.1 JmjC domain-containing protein [Nannizzia gypsea CBS 118893]